MRRKIHLRLCAGAVLLALPVAATSTNAVSGTAGRRPAVPQGTEGVTSPRPPSRSAAWSRPRPACSTSLDTAQVARRVRAAGDRRLDGASPTRPGRWRRRRSTTSTSPGLPWSPTRSRPTTMRQADPTCGIDWTLLAAIGRVETDHGRHAGARLRRRRRLPPADPRRRARRQGAGRGHPRHRRRPPRRRPELGPRGRADAVPAVDMGPGRRGRRRRRGPLPRRHQRRGARRRRLPVCRPRSAGPPRWAADRGAPLQPLRSVRRPRPPPHHGLRRRRAGHLSTGGTTLALEAIRTGPSGGTTTAPDTSGPDSDRPAGPRGNGGNRRQE